MICWDRGVVMGLSRRVLLCGIFVSTVAACSSGRRWKHTSAWDEVDVDGLSVVVPSDWNKIDFDSNLWKSAWLSGDKKSRIMVAPHVSATSVYDAMSSAMNAARSTMRGYKPVGERVALQDGSDMRIRQDYVSEMPEFANGSVWVISKGQQYALVDIAGPGISEGHRDEIGRRCVLQPAANTATCSSEDPSANASGVDSSGAVVVDASGVLFSIPQTWQNSGGVEGSERWTYGWALLGKQGTASARVLVAPEMPQKSVREALAQIEVDHVGGSLSGYTVRSRHQLDAANLDEGVRTDFVWGDSGGSQGCLWVASANSRVFAVQYVSEKQIDAKLREQIEGSLRLRC
mgnify:CR=1 FL=1